MITSKDNEKLKLIRRLAERKHREREGLFVAEGEDLIEAAAAAGHEPEFVLRAGVDVESSLLDAVSALGSGSRAIGVYREAWSQPAGPIVYLHGVGDPGQRGRRDPQRARSRRRHGGAWSGLRRSLLVEGGAREHGLDLRPAGRARRDRRAARAARRPGRARRRGARRATRWRRSVSVPSARDCPPRWPRAATGSGRSRCVSGGAESLNVAAAAAIALGRISSAA